MPTEPMDEAELGVVEDQPDPTRSTSEEVKEALGKVTLDRLSFLRVIGVGSFGTVKLTRDNHTGAAFAVKEIAKARLPRPKDIAKFVSEKTILESIKHPLVVDYYGTCQDAKKLYLVMEFVQGGELLSLLDTRGTLTVEETRFYAAEIAAGLTYLHSQDVIYRDLKPENVLISQSGHIKLVDFSCAKRVKRSERTYTLCGTPHALAPEVLTRSGHGFQVDWWSYGVLLHEMLTGSSPFEADSVYLMYANIIKKTYTPPRHVPCDIQRLLQGLLHKDPRLRYKGDEVYNHRLFQGVDWKNLEDLSPVFIPLLKAELDDSHFGQYSEEESVEEPETQDFDRFKDIDT